MFNEFPWPSDLNEVSAKIGRNLNFVQGPGGNTSFKDESNIWIKASGTRLVDADTKCIFAQVSRHAHERDVTQTTSDPWMALQPSIELPLHAIISSSYVVHTHSVSAISLGLRVDATTLLADHPEIAIIPYVRPGDSLSNKLKEVVDTKSTKVALLQNHGLLTWGEDILEIYEYLVQFEGAFATYKTLGFASELEMSEATARDYAGYFITPDQAVFLDDEYYANRRSRLLVNPWLGDLEWAIEESIRRVPNSVEINYLALEEIVELQNWDLEKKRKKMNS